MDKKYSASSVTINPPQVIINMKCVKSPVTIKPPNIVKFSNISPITPLYKNLNIKSISNINSLSMNCSTNDSTVKKSKSIGYIHNIRDNNLNSPLDYSAIIDNKKNNFNDFILIKNRGDVNIKVQDRYKKLRDKKFKADHKFQNKSLAEFSASIIKNIKEKDIKLMNKFGRYILSDEEIEQKSKKTFDEFMNVLNKANTEHESSLFNYYYPDWCKKIKSFKDFFNSYNSVTLIDLYEILNQEKTFTNLKIFKSELHKFKYLDKLNETQQDLFYRDSITKSVKKYELLHNFGDEMQYYYLIIEGEFQIIYNDKLIDVVTIYDTIGPYHVEIINKKYLCKYVIKCTKAARLVAVPVRCFHNLIHFYYNTELSKRIEFLMGISHFSPMLTGAPEDRDKFLSLYDKLELEYYKKDQHVFDEGDCDLENFYIVYSGKFILQKRANREDYFRYPSDLSQWECHERVESYDFNFREYVKGELFGLEIIHEMRDSRYAHVICVEEGEVFRISRKNFISITNNETIDKLKESKYYYADTSRLKTYLNLKKVILDAKAKNIKLYASRGKVKKKILRRYGQESLMKNWSDASLKVDWDKARTAKHTDLYYDKKILLDRRIHYDDRSEIERVGSYQGLNYAPDVKYRKPIDYIGQDWSIFSSDYQMKKRIVSENMVQYELQDIEQLRQVENKHMFFSDFNKMKDYDMAFKMSRDHKLLRDIYIDDVHGVMHM